jgi:Undecaprenyl-phosphate glucose phosphotransferase
LAAISSVPQRQAASASRRWQRNRLVRLLLTALLIGCDALAVNGAFLGVYAWRLATGDLSQFALPDSATRYLFILLLNLAFAVAFWSSGLYTLKRGASRVDEIYKVFSAISLGTFASFAINTLLIQFGRDPIPWTAQILLLSWGAALVATVVLRLLHRVVVRLLRRSGFDTRKVLIVGAREPGRLVWNKIRRADELGYRVQGFLSDTTRVGELVDGLPVLGRTENLSRVIRATGADEVVIALSGRSTVEVLDVVALAEDEAVEVKVYPDAFQIITNNEISIGDLDGLPLVSVRNVALDNPLNRALKRGLDVVTATMVLVLTSPLLLLLALLIKLDSPGPIFFIQPRVGLDGRPFPMIKFRSMRAEVSGTGWTRPNDERRTRLGRFMRRYSLDELPQFVNVVLGDMSVVGPRPEQPAYVAQFSQSIPRYMRRHKEKAGITGWAQVNGLRGDTSIEERTRYDLYYVENWSLLFDIKIMLKTAVQVFEGEAY